MYTYNNKTFKDFESAFNKLLSDEPNDFVSFSEDREYTSIFRTREKVYTIDKVRPKKQLNVCGHILISV